jgi:hypothetical protein
MTSPRLLIYIIISPIAIYEEVPKHDNSNCNGKGEIPGEKFWRDRCSELQTLKEIQQKRFAKFQDGDADSEAGNVDCKKHYELAMQWTGARVGVGPIAVPDKVADYGTGK